MKATPAAIPDLLIIEPQVFGDARGFFMESFNQKTFYQITGLDVQFVQDNHLQLWVPAGFAHGFVVLSDTADVLYKTTDYYAPSFERCIRWNDPKIGIQWPYPGNPQLSAKDNAAVSLEHADVFA